MVLLSYIFTFSLISILAYLLWRQEYDSLLKKVFLPALILKLVLGVLLGFFYRKYGGDANAFHKQALILHQYFLDSPINYLKFLFTGNFESESVKNLIYYKWWSNSYFMVKLLSLTNLLTNGHFYLNSLCFSFFSFFGCWQLTKTLCLYNRKKAHPAIFCFLFLPSVTFWSAGISKEAVYLGSFCWFLSLVLRYVYKREIQYPVFIGALLLSAYFLWKIKYFFAVGIFALVFIYVLLHFKKLKKHFPVQKNYYIPFLLLLVTVVLLIIPLAHVFNLDYFLHELTRNYSVLLATSGGKPTLFYPNLEPDFSSVLSYVPVAFFNAAFRPFIWESTAVLYVIAGLEDLIWLLITIVTLVSLFFYKPKTVDSGIILLGIYCLVIGSIIGLSTPNLGTLSRYKTAFLPFFIYICLQAPLFAGILQRVNSGNSKL